MKPPVGFVVDWGDPISKGLVGCWLFNEGAGTKVFDISGKNNRGTLTNGPTWGTGQIGGGVVFTSASSQCIVASNVTAPLFSISAWVYKKTTGSQSVVAQTNSGTTQSSFELRINGNSGFSAGGVFKEVTIPDISLNTWHHVLLIYNGSDLRYYLDGVLTVGPTAKSGTPDTPANSFAIGRLGAYTGGQYWDGSIDEVRIYNRALSATEARRLYTEPFAGIETPKRKNLYVAGADATSFFDGKIVIKSSGTNLLDGKVQIKDVVTALLDGKVSIGSIQQDILDGKLRIKDTGISYLDGKVIVKDIATTLLDGKLEITQGGTDTASLDAKIRIKDALTALVDGKVMVKSTATDILDGKLTIGTGATNLLDGKIQIKDIATALLDGKIQVKSATVSLLDGKIVIADGISSFSSNNQLFIDSIGGKVLQLGNSRINTWNTAGRPSSPKTGTIGLNTQTIALDVFDGSTWKSITLS